MTSFQLIRTCSALIAGTALFTGVATAAGAVDSFNVSTTLTNTCTVTDAGPADLTPTYAPTTDSGTGVETNLNTFCNGDTPSVTFTDAYASGSTVFAMNAGGGSHLFYQISSDPTCDGTPGDLPFTEGVAQQIPQGQSAFEICAAVIAGSGMNTGVPAGAYTDNVIYTLAP